MFSQTTSIYEVYFHYLKHFSYSEIAQWQVWGLSIGKIVGGGKEGRKKEKKKERKLEGKRRRKEGRKGEIKKEMKGDWSHLRIKYSQPLAMSIRHANYSLKCLSLLFICSFSEPLWVLCHLCLFFSLCILSLSHLLCFPFKVLC